jgi:nicotinamidase-related amidase
MKKQRASRHKRLGGERGGAALLVIDMLSPYEHDDAERLAGSARGAADSIGVMLDGAQRQDLPVIYVNDNYGNWNTSAEDISQRALSGRHPELVEPLLPPEGARFVLKARHSIFFGTPLEYLLDTLGVERLILTGQVTEQCILYSALDAYVRHFGVVVPRDAVAHIYRHLADSALEMMERNMSAEVLSSYELGRQG